MTNPNPTSPGYYLCKLRDYRSEISLYFNGEGWEYRYPNGTVLPVTELLFWREFPEWRRDLPAVDYVENSRRYPRLQELYRKAGRDRKDDPQHGLFTGLAQEAGF